MSENEQEYSGTNMGAVIRESLSQEHAPYPAHNAVVARDAFASFAHVETVAFGRNNNYDSSTVVVAYDETFCKRMQDDMYCRPLRKAGTALSVVHFIVRHYDDLPERMIVTEAPTRLVELLGTGTITSERIRDNPLYVYKNLLDDIVVQPDT
jgi:hypothetical protein